MKTLRGQSSQTRVSEDKSSVSELGNVQKYKRGFDFLAFADVPETSHCNAHVMAENAAPFLSHLYWDLN